MLRLISKQRYAYANIISKLLQKVHIFQPKPGWLCVVFPNLFILLKHITTYKYSEAQQVDKAQYCIAERTLHDKNTRPTNNL